MSRLRSPYFDGPRPRILAHRGLALTVAENTLPAFEAAIAAGADFVESDIHATADGVAVLAHDANLSRLAGQPIVIADTPWERLRTIDVGGATLPSLAEALTALPTTRFNLDLKAEAALAPTVAAILETDALDRVLITSFTGARRRRATARLPAVAASAGPGELVAAHLAGIIGAHGIARWFLRHVDAVQIPERGGPFRLDSRRSIAAFHRAGVEVHFWTINDPARMRELIELGADGIVTDRADLAVAALRA